MKNLKLFTLLTAGSTLLGVIPVLNLTSCNKPVEKEEEQPVVEPTTEQKQPTISKGATTWKFNFTLKDEAEASSLVVSIPEQSKENDDLIKYINHTCSGKTLSINVKWIGDTTKDTTCNFSFKIISSKGWKYTISGCQYKFLTKTDQNPQEIIDDVNAVLAKAPICHTMSEALEATKSVHDIENAVIATEGYEYVWDQIANRFAVIDAKGNYVYVSAGYTQNTNKWQLWKIVTESTFDSFNPYSQYLKAGSSNPTRTDYSSISGFDTGSNTNVKYYHYFYEKAKTGEQTGKDIIINTKQKTTNVDISGWVGNGSDQDVVKHFGQMGELNIITNGTYKEFGKTICATTYSGEMSIDTSSLIEWIYVRATGVTINLDSQSAADAIAAETDEIKTDLLTRSTLQEKSVSIIPEYYFQWAKEGKIEEEGGIMIHTFTVYDDAGLKDPVHYESLTAIQLASNASENPELFEGKTIVLNKDYDMSFESDSWIPICNGTEYFQGTINGNGHSILNFNKTDDGNIALINNNSGNICNLNFIDCSIKSNQNKTAFLALVTNGAELNISNINFFNCSTDSHTSSGFAMGEINGGMRSITIEKCYTDSNCYAKGTPMVSEYTGFVGLIHSGSASAYAGELTFKDCEMHLSIEANDTVGSFVGRLGTESDAGFLTYRFVNCSSYGDIVLTNSTSALGSMGGGFVGSKKQLLGTEPPAMSFITLFNDCQNYSNVYAKGKYTAGIDCLGGFIGYNSDAEDDNYSITFTKCTNYGKIGKEDETSGYKPNGAGGFIGKTMSSKYVRIKFSECRNKGLITSTSSASNHVCGHFIGVLGSDVAPYTKWCVDCSIEGGQLAYPDHRTIITGEPE